MDDEELFVALADRLRDAHRRIAALEWPDDEKARVIRRLLAISDATKHNLPRDAARLDVLLADLDAGRRPDLREA